MCACVSVCGRGLVLVCLAVGMGVGVCVFMCVRVSVCIFVFVCMYVCVGGWAASETIYSIWWIIQIGWIIERLASGIVNAALICLNIA